MKGMENGGYQTLEQMNLDRGDDEQAPFDPFYNPLNNIGSAYGPNIQLKAQNKYMGKENTEKIDMWEQKKE